MRDIMDWTYDTHRHQTTMKMKYFQQKF